MRLSTIFSVVFRRYTMQILRVRRRFWALFTRNTQTLASEAAACSVRLREKACCVLMGEPHAVPVFRAIVCVLALIHLGKDVIRTHLFRRFSVFKYIRPNSIRTDGIRPNSIRPKLMLNGIWEYLLVNSTYKTTFSSLEKAHLSELFIDFQGVLAPSTPRLCNILFTSNTPKQRDDMITRRFDFDHTVHELNHMFDCSSVQRESL